MFKYLKFCQMAVIYLPNAMQFVAEDSDNKMQIIAFSPLEKGHPSQTYVIRHCQTERE